MKEVSGEVYVDALLPILVNLNRSKVSMVHEYRKIIELGSIDLVLERATEEDIKELKKIIKKMESLKDDLEEFAMEDLNFHLTLSELTKNPIIEKTNYLMINYLREAMISIIKKWDLSMESIIIRRY
ncbi:MAG: FCD domain-containing protein [Halanaerobiales bacterium]